MVRATLSWFSRSANEMVTAPAEAGQKEIFSSWALFILIMLLILALFTSYMLQSKKIQAVHETVISIIAGRQATPYLHEHIELNYIQACSLASLYGSHQEVLYRTVSASIINSSSTYYYHPSSSLQATNYTRLKTFQPNVIYSTNITW
jgi:hypothetical protein